ncbi:MAG TPA: peptidylprolyl isomerase [Myxococcaceae bacterium]|nr:peptidylprolyl isomerase [Myxococcaceae bacterium]
MTGRLLPSLALILALAACSRGVPPSQPSPAIARFDGGVVTEAELRQALQKLPPAMRSNFDSLAGQRDVAASLVDRRLLVLEAERRGLASDPDIQRQVRELEERLLIQSLVDQEQRTAGKAPEAELRAYYDAQRESFATPVRIKVGRVMLRVPQSATAADRARAHQRVERWAARLKAGESLTRVAAEGEGPEKAQGGVLGPLTRADIGDRAFADAAFSLKTPGTVSPVFAQADGLAVVKLLERTESRIPPFEEVRPAVEAKVAPGRQRQVFEELINRLRKSSDVRIDLARRL